MIFIQFSENRRKMQGVIHKKNGFGIALFLFRSYVDKSCIQVSIFDDRIEVLSPGMLYGGLDIETAKSGKSTCRNEAIAEVFHYMHIVEAWGTGIPRIINRCKEYDFEKYLPLFKEAEITEKFIENSNKVFLQSGVNNSFGQKNVMEWLNCSKSKATNVMNAMKAAKVIEKVTGAGPGKYRFIEKKSNS